MRNSRAFVALMLCGAIGAACASGGGSGGGSSSDISAPATDATDVVSTVADTSIPQETVELSTATTVEETPPCDGSERMHFEVGPIDVQPGQNNIAYEDGIPQPTVDGWITRM